MLSMTLNYFMIIFLASVRIVAMILSSPIYSVSQIPPLVKVGLSLVIGTLIAGTINISHVILPTTNYSFLLIVFKEAAIGVTIGYLSTLIFNAIRVSAQLMDFSMGFSMAQYYDPSTSGTATPLDRFFNWFAMVLFLTLNFHHVIISAVLRSFEIAPIGNFVYNHDIPLYILQVFSGTFTIAIQLAAPIVVILFITDFTMGLISRTVPQINVFVLGMPIKVLVGLLSLTIILPGLTVMYAKTFSNLPGELLKFFNAFPVLILMASEEKTEEPTQKKISDAKKKGQVAKSIDLTSAVILLGVTLLLINLGSTYYTNGRLFIIDSMNRITKEPLLSGDIHNVFIYMLKYGLIAAFPVLGLVMILGLVSNIAQMGFIISEEGLKPKLDKINPMEGFKRLFNKRTLVELVKNITKICVIAYVTLSYVKGKIGDILKTSDLNTNGIYPFVKDITDSQLIRLVAVLFIIGIADFVFQKRQLKKDLRMTKQEIKEEYKQQEGDPQIKSRIRQKQRELAMRRMMHDVPKATVVVTNPTHFAVALKYERNVDSAPTVVAKGADLVAFRIKQIAKDNSIPVVENKEIARALYFKVDIDSQVPAELYQAVAEIIAYVYSLKKN